MSFSWVSSTSRSGLPPNAVQAGHDVDGAPIYVGRAFHEGDQIPAKVIPSKNVAYVAHGGVEHAKHQYDVLCGSGFTWIVSASGHVPDNAVVAGTQANGEPLYIGRTHVNGSLIPGKIQASHGCIYVPFDGVEHSQQQYEVLVGSRRSMWMPTSIGAPLPEGAILAGNDQDGSPIYVGRAYHEADHIPAKVLPTKNAAYIAYGGQEHLKQQYDVLCYGNVAWVQSGHGSIPPGAVQAGQTSSGEPLFVGRAHYQGSVTIGKVQASHGTLYIPFDGSEVPIKEYEVLVEN